MKLVKRFVKLLKEPSTYAGLAGTLASLGIMSEAKWQTIFTALAAVAGVVAMFLLESGDKEEEGGE